MIGRTYDNLLAAAAGDALGSGATAARPFEALKADLSAALSRLHRPRETVSGAEPLAGR